MQPVRRRRSPVVLCVALGVALAAVTTVLVVTSSMDRRSATDVVEAFRDHLDADDPSSAAELVCSETATELAELSTYIRRPTGLLRLEVVEPGEWGVVELEPRNTLGESVVLRLERTPADEWELCSGVPLERYLGWP